MRNNCGALDAHLLAEHLVRNDHLGDHALAAGLQHVDLGVLLVGVDVARQQEFGVSRMVLTDPFAGGKRGLAGHVLACGVARCEIEPQIPQRSHRILTDTSR